MGLPRQVEQMDAEADKALEQDARFEAGGGKIVMTDNTPHPAPQDAAPPPAPQPPPPPSEDGQAELGQPPPPTDGELPDGKLMQRLSSVSGRLAKNQGELRLAKDEIAALRARAEKAEQERDAARARRSSP